MRRRKWTDQELALLKELYPSTEVFVSDIAARLNRPVSSVFGKARQLGLYRPFEMFHLAGKKGSRSEAAKAHQFGKGHVPANKGKKLSPELRAMIAPTMFKKGDIPRNHREVGSERVNVDGYIEIKVAEPNVWKQKHRVIWEAAHGPIPKGHNIQFKDGNHLNVALDNLYCISRADQLRQENCMEARYPEKLRSLIRLRGTLRRQITLHDKKVQQSPGNEQ